MIIIPVAAYATSQNPSIIRLLVLGNKLVDGFDVLLLSLLGAQVLELSPLVVLCPALCHTSQFLLQQLFRRDK